MTETTGISLQHRCSNCGTAAAMPVLAQAGGTHGPLVLSVSDGNDAYTAQRVVCPSCGVVEAAFEPGAAVQSLRRSVRSERARNPLVIRDGSPLAKRSLIEARLIDHCADRFPDGMPGTLLDIACGEGHITRRFAHRFQSWKAIGVDNNPMLTDDWPPALGRPGYIRDRFDPTLFAGQTFDVVLAHCVLNRGPVLPQLKQIRSVCKDDAVVSFDLVMLESGVTAPHVWDHVSLFTRDALESWFAVTGFELVDAEDCGATWHILARATDPSGDDLTPDSELGRDAQVLFKAHQTWWRRIAIRAERAHAVASAQNQAIALYGAGLFNKILMGLVPQINPVLIIDDTQVQEPFLGRPVVSRAEAAERPVTVLLCARPDYAPYMAGQLKASGISAVDLSADTPLSLDAQRPGAPEPAFTPAN